MELYEVMEVLGGTPNHPLLLSIEIYGDLAIPQASSKMISDTFSSALRGWLLNGYSPSAESMP